jgi:hypothetical protein
MSTVSIYMREFETDGEVEIIEESFGQLWEYASEGWARRFFENWRQSLRWQKPQALREVRGDERASLGRQSIP